MVVNYYPDDGNVIITCDDKHKIIKFVSKIQYDCNHCFKYNPIGGVATYALIREDNVILLCDHCKQLYEYKFADAEFQRNYDYYYFLPIQYRLKRRLPDSSIKVANKKRLIPNIVRQFHFFHLLE